MSCRVVSFRVVDVASIHAYVPRFFLDRCAGNAERLLEIAIFISTPNKVSTWVDPVVVAVGVGVMLSSFAKALLCLDKNPAVLCCDRPSHVVLTPL